MEVRSREQFGHELLAVNETRIKAVNNRERNFTRAMPVVLSAARSAVIESADRATGPHFP